MHDRDQALAAVTEAAQVFDTFNLGPDVRLAGPDLGKGLTQDIQTALAFAPPHISIYHLTIEPNTVFAKFPPTLPEDDLAYEMMDRITELTAAWRGSTGTRSQPMPSPDMQCAHNLNYWQFGDYSGHWRWGAQQAQLCAPCGEAGALQRACALHAAGHEG